MDMTYIKETLHSLRYESVVEFVRDVQLIFQNCRSYNQVREHVLLRDIVAWKSILRRKKFFCNCF